MIRNVDEIKQFITNIFGRAGENEHTLFWSTKKIPGFPVSQETFFTKSIRSGEPKACYFGTATVSPDKDGLLRNRSGVFNKLYCIVLDDLGDGIGAKCSIDALPVAMRDDYSWRIESSPGNWQYGFLLDEPIDDLYCATELVQLIYGAGAWDSGGSMATKLVRLPCGHNIKDNYRIDGKLWDLQPDEDYDKPFNTFTPDELLEMVGAGVTWADILSHNAGKLNPRKRKGATVWREGVYRSNLEGVVDDVLEFLNDRESIVNETNEWIDIICPWCDKHSEGGGNTAGYKPLGSGYKPETRVFHCFHGHCEDKRTTEFLAWVNDEGGPLVPRVDPVPLLVAKFAHDQLNGCFVNLKNGKYTRIPYAGFKTATQKSVHWMGFDGKPKTATEYNLIVKSPSLLTLNGSVYAPGKTSIINDGEDKMLNEWYVPDWAIHSTVGEDAHWAKFEEFIRYLMPNPGDADWFFDHLASKVQTPVYRGPCILLTTPVFGSGRGTLGDILSSLWGSHNVSTVGLSELITGLAGEGFNDWLCSSWVIIPEAREAQMTRRVEQRAYESLKSGIDTRPTQHEVKIKYGSQGPCMVYSSYVICSNHDDVLNIPVTDRRFKNIHCTTHVWSVDKFIEFNDWLNEDMWQASVWKRLLGRDISHYNGYAPPVTDLSNDEKYERALDKLSGQSAIDQLVTISCMFADEKCHGAICMNAMVRWVSAYPTKLGVDTLPNWEKIYKSALKRESAALKHDGKGVCLWLFNATQRVRHTINATGLALADKAKDTNCSVEITENIQDIKAEDFRDYVDEVMRNADI